MASLDLDDWGSLEACSGRTGTSKTTVRTVNIDFLIINIILLLEHTIRA